MHISTKVSFTILQRSQLKTKEAIIIQVDKPNQRRYSGKVWDLVKSLMFAFHKITGHSLNSFFFDANVSFALIETPCM